MTRTTKIIEAEFVDFKCEQCLKGFYRVDSNKKPIDTYPKQWPHKCSNCQHETYFTVIYPLLKYKNREFIMLR